MMPEHSSPSLDHSEGLKMQPIQGKPKITQREIKAVPDAQVSGGRQGGGERLSCDLWAVLGLSLLPGLGQFDDFCCKLEERETYAKEEICIPLA